MAKSKPTARHKLELSRLRVTHDELLTAEIDHAHFILQMRGVVGIDVIEAIVDADVERTIEGASTLTVTIADHDRTLGKSGRLHARQDVKIDGLWFRLVKVSKQGDNLVLTFENREVAVLRTYDKIIKNSLATSRNKITRAQFVLRMIKEVKEFKIPYKIPELQQVQPLEVQTDQTVVTGQEDPVASGGGIPGATSVTLHKSGITVATGSSGPHQDVKLHKSGTNVEIPLTVKHKEMTENQRRIANTILDVGVSQSAPHKALVLAIMVATQESQMTNLPQPRPGAKNYLSDDPRKNPVGVFQQIAFWGWPASRDVAKDAAGFFRAAIPTLKKHPNTNLGEVADIIQDAGTPQAFGQWEHEATQTVAAYGETGNIDPNAANSQNNPGAAAADYEFYRGVPGVKGAKWQHENSWACIQRLADEVNWRAFFVSGTFYYISEAQLFKNKPAWVGSEDSKGVDNIDYDYDEGKKNAECEMTVHTGLWSFPPGSIIKLQNMGVVNGRWLVTTVRRNLFTDEATVTIKKPRPRLPEPFGTNVDPTTAGFSGQPGGTPQGSTPGIAAGVYVDPFENAKVQGDRIDMGVDYHGSGPIRAIGAAKIIGLGGSGWPGNQYLLYQLTDGPFAGKYIYVAEGIIPTVKAGQRVKAGDVIARFGLNALPGAFPGIETGWGSSVLNRTYASATTGYNEGEVTRAGKAFARLLKELGAPVRDDPGDGPLFPA